MNVAHRILAGLLCVGMSVSSNSCSSSKGTSSSIRPSVVEWQLAALNEPGAAGIRKSGNPLTIDSPKGRAVQFDGKEDGLFIDDNPLIRLSQFTVEVLFRPDPKGEPEQRFVHMGEVNGERLMIETRLTPDDQWYLDAHLRSGDSAKTLIDKTLLHPTGKWCHVAVVVNNGKIDTFVDGNHELSGAIRFAPLTKGQTSLGVRQNKRSWFKGAIATIRITPKCLTPEEFISR